jgi:hypothetical protein
MDRTNFRSINTMRKYLKLLARCQPGIDGRSI